MQNGTFSVIGGVLHETKRLRGEQLRQLHRVALRAASGETTKERATSEAIAIAPRLAGTIGSLSEGQWMLLVAVLTLLLNAYFALVPNPELKDISAKLSRQNATQEQIARLLEQQHQTDEELLAEARKVAEVAEAKQMPLNQEEAQSRHVRTPKPLTKRQRRRLRGKSDGAR